MNADAAGYLRFESELAAALIEVLAKDGHYDFKFARTKTTHGVEWSLTGRTEGLPYVALLLTEADRDTTIVLIQLDDSRVTETVTGRQPHKVRAAIDRLRSRAELRALFDSSQL